MVKTLIKTGTQRTAGWGRCRNEGEGIARGKQHINFSETQSLGNNRVAPHQSISSYHQAKSMDQKKEDTSKPSMLIKGKHN